MNLQAVRRRLALAGVVLSSLLLVVRASADEAIKGQVLGGGAPIANSKVILYAATAVEPKQLAQTKTDNEGRFEVRTTGAPADSSFYLLAFGGEPKVRGGGDNSAIALLAVLGSKPPAHVVINEMTTVASVWTNAQFLVGATLKGPVLGLRIAAGNVPNFVNLSTGGWGEAIQNPLNSSQTPTMANFATLADLISACVTRVVVASQRLRGRRAADANWLLAKRRPPTATRVLSKGTVVRRLVRQFS